jgi:hypothetical protein
VPKRTLNPGTFEDLWVLYQLNTTVAEQVSKSTLASVWHANWERFLKFRNEGQGKRCKICARLDQERLQAVTADEKARVGREKKAHIDQVKADREVHVRECRLSEQAAENPSVDGQDQVLKITIDGMDQAKFRCPRNLSSNAEFDSCWKPQLHVTGAIIHGHLECYFIMNPDQPKDASMNCTVISRCLDLVRAKIDDQYTLPRVLLVQADNTTRESKNQHFCSYMGYLITKEVFDGESVEYMVTSHTHNEQDRWPTFVNCVPNF